MDAGLGSRAARVLAVLAILLGVLAMHGLAGGHHGTVPVAGGAAAATTGHPSAHSVAGALDIAHEGLAAAAAAVPLVNDVAAGCEGACSEGASGLMLLCVAVLSAVAAAVLRARATMARRVPDGAGLPGPRPLTAVLPRPRDPVADLCISRT